MQDNLSSSFSGKTSELSKRLFKGDPILWGVAITLAIMSLLVVYSATGTLAYLKTQNTASFLFKRVTLIGICLSIMVIISNIHYSY